MSDDVVVPGLARPDSRIVAAPDSAAETAYAEIRETILAARQRTRAAINSETVAAYWQTGRRIVETQGERAEYGKRLLLYLSQRLTREFGAGFKESNLRNMRQFYLAFPIRHTLRSELSWSHYRELMRLADGPKRDFYVHEAAESGWSVRQLQRQLDTRYYERLLTAPGERRAEVATEIEHRVPRTSADDLLKDPYVFEFLDIPQPAQWHERDLEMALIARLQDFLLELGRGFSFVGRQRRVSTDGGEHFYVDLVFYNYLLKCFVLIDLKVGKLGHQDVGQMDFYRRIFDDRVRPEGDNPTIGLILCSAKDDAIVRYSILSDDVGLYAASYTTYLPTEDELRQELVREREEIDAQQAYQGDRYESD